MKPKEWIKILQAKDPEESVCIHMWVVEDVIGQAKEMHKRITKKEAQQVLEDIERKFNSEFGISWDTINNGIEKLLNSKKK